MINDNGRGRISAALLQPQNHSACLSSYVQETQHKFIQNKTGIMHSVVVFCGSSAGSDPVYTRQAAALGQTLAKQDIAMVYGGARIGLMGATADACLAAGGRVTGVIPGFLQTREVVHSGLSELIVVETMHERKLKMHELSQGIITLPGGFGTMEELFEMLTWAQLGLHQKPIGLLNTNGFYICLLDLCDTMVSQGFLARSIRDMLLVAGTPAELLEQMRAYEPPEVPQWITKQTT
jgi:uncharacterized protein (TIGR00730 family)